jgi:hypothetical protein
MKTAKIYLKRNIRTTGEQYFNNEKVQRRAMPVIRRENTEI